MKMIKKQLTCGTYLPSIEKCVVAARLDTDSPEKNVVHYEHDPHTGVTRHYLSGEVANLLHEYEQLGFTPEELKEIIRQHKMFKSIEESMHHPYLIAGRRNGKSLLAARDVIEYIMNDVSTTSKLAGHTTVKEHQDGLCAKVTLIDEMHAIKPDPWMLSKRLNVPRNLEIEKVIFNDPATIVIWKDGTKTVVKATNEEYDPEKGLAMAITKKALGNKGNYFETIKKYVGAYEEAREDEEVNQLSIFFKQLKGK
jgi:hypothetical protein